MVYLTMSNKANYLSLIPKVFDWFGVMISELLGWVEILYCIMRVHEKFISISQHYSNNVEMIHDFWQEITQAYNGRAYHNLGHLQAIYEELEELRSKIHHYDALL